MEQLTEIMIDFEDLSELESYVVEQGTIGWIEYNSFTNKINFEIELHKPFTFNSDRYVTKEVFNEVQVELDKSQRAFEELVMEANKLEEKYNVLVEDLFKAEEKIKKLSQRPFYKFW